MGTGNPVVLYYDITLILSVVMTGIYMFLWHKRFETHITLIFALEPILCLGYSLLAHATVTQEALAINKLVYMGGCFLELIILLAVASLCQIRIPRGLKLLLFAMSTAVYISALNVGYSNNFYTQVSVDMKDGFPVLVKEYGWMHTVFRGWVLLCFLGTLGMIVYTLFRKKQISRKILGLLILPEVIAMVAFFGGRKITDRIELLPAAYVAAQVVYLIIAARINLYDVTATAVDSLVENGDTGFISIDYGNHYLGSNAMAKEVFPELHNLTVDLSVNRSKAFSEFVLPMLRQYDADESKDSVPYEKDGKYYQIDIAPLINGRRDSGYQLTVTDNTKDQLFIRMMQRFNDQLQEEVDKKTAHIQEMHDRLILGMATMVEKRDNSTGGHIRRTSEGVKILLGEMSEKKFPEITQDFRKKLIKAAPMHDLGKIAVDDEILRKPGRFTPEEFEKMKAHAAEGAKTVHEILKDTDDEEFHVIAESVAQFHHERWDGSGYPDGLKGEEIPLEARIMAVADVYDALVSKRVYKDRMSFERANQIMMEGMGSQFAPEMEAVYCRARPKLEAYYSRVEQQEEKEEA